MFTEEHELFRDAARKFVDKELAPHADEWEEAEGFPDSVFTRMGELGYLGLRFPEKYGGQDCDFLFSVVLAEELGRCGMGSIGMAVAVQSEMATPPIYKFGTEEQKMKYLLPANQGKKIACLGISEPNAGSDVAAIQTTARRDGDHWVINGRKIFITNGVRAHFITLVARTGEKRGYKGFSLFLVDKETPGFTVTRKLDKVGMRSSDTAELLFEDCRVPADALLGEEGQGFYHIMWELQGERIMGAANAVSRAQMAYELALKYSRERVQFGKPLTHFQVTRHRLADMATEIEAAKHLIYYCAWQFQRGEVPSKEISMAKLFSAQMSARVADAALQIHGGYGYMMEYPVQRFWRDIRLSRIGGGTDEIMKEIIANEVLGKVKE
jgi:alkylation response protein AidB-like acyl-CoA dehydrogenase